MLLEKFQTQIIVVWQLLIGKAGAQHGTGILTQKESTKADQLNLFKKNTQSGQWKK